MRMVSALVSLAVLGGCSVLGSASYVQFNPNAAYLTSQRVIVPESDLRSGRFDAQCSRGVMYCETSGATAVCSCGKRPVW